MNRFLIFVVLLLLMTACVSEPVAIETQTMPAISTAQPAPASTGNNNVLITVLPEPTKAGGMPPVAEDTNLAGTNVGGTKAGDANETLWLQVITPQDGDIVTQKGINVSGQAPAETVISLNEDIFLVPGDGSFSIPVTLEEGPNVLELVASNIDGDEIELVITIIYEKE